MGLKTMATLQLVPAASVTPEQPSSTWVKSSGFAPRVAALLMNSEALPELVTLIDCDALVVPVSCGPKVSEVGVSVTAGAEVGVGEGDGDGEAAVQPDSLADVDVEVPSVTVTWQVEELYDDFSTLNAPLPSLEPGTAPGFTVTAWLGAAPLPSTRSCVPLSSARLMVMAAAAFAAPSPNVAAIVAAMRPRTCRPDMCFLRERERASGGKFPPKPVVATLDFRPTTSGTGAVAAREAHAAGGAADDERHGVGAARKAAQADRRASARAAQRRAHAPVEQDGDPARVARQPDRHRAAAAARGLRTRRGGHGARRRRRRGVRVAVGGVEGQPRAPLPVARAGGRRGDERRARQVEAQVRHRGLEVRRRAGLRRRALAERVGRRDRPVPDGRAQPAALVGEQLDELLAAVEDVDVVDERIEGGPPVRAQRHRPLADPAGRRTGLRALRLQLGVRRRADGDLGAVDPGAAGQLDRDLALGRGRRVRIVGVLERDPQRHAGGRGRLAGPEAELEVGGGGRLGAGDRGREEGEDGEDQESAHGAVVPG